MSRAGAPSPDCTEPDLRLEYFLLRADTPAWQATEPGKDLLRRLTGFRLHPSKEGDVLLASPASVIAYWELCDQLDFGHTRILLVGERGVGKEVFARLAAEHVDLPRVSVNCATLVESLAEAQLFGIARGAGVAGADPKGTQGLVTFEKPHVVFLDEFFDAPATVFPKLLRLLQLGSYFPVGSWDERCLPQRTILLAASNKFPTEQTVRDAVTNGAVREDVIDRFNEIVEIPPLRERCEEIPALGGALVARTDHYSGLAAESALTLRDVAHKWPGNIRELQRFMSAQVRLRRHSNEKGILTIPHGAVHAHLGSADKAADRQVRSAETSPLSMWTKEGLRRQRQRELMAHLRSRMSEEGLLSVDAAWVAREARRVLGCSNVSQRLRDALEQTCQQLADLLASP